MQLHSHLKHWRLAWRQLRGAPGQAAIVVLGLAVGIALSLLGAAYLQDKLSPATGVPRPETVVTFEMRLRGPGGSHTDWWDAAPAGSLHDALRAAGAPVQAMGRVLRSNVTLRTTEPGGANPRSARLAARMVDAEVGELLGLQAVAGDLQAALSRPDSVALTESAAEKLFGTRQALGRQLSLFVPVFEESAEGGYSATLTVTALLPRPAANGLLGSYEVLTGFGSPPAQIYLKQESSWYLAAGQLLARLQPGTSPEQLSQLAQHLLEQQPLPPAMPADYLKGGGRWAYLRAMPLSDLGWDGAGSALRRLQMTGLAGAGAAVLGLGMINFINLWSVRTLRRQREIGLRKSLGAGVSGLLAQFFAETLLVVLLAGATGLLLAWWATPVLEALMQHQYDHSVLAPGLLASTLLGCLLVALLSALPLASVALRVRPSESLAGRNHSEGRAGRWLRRGMTTLQFAAAALFAALAVVVLWQSHHAAGLERGVQISDRLAFDVPLGAPPEQSPALLRRIQGWPEVIAAAASSDVPGRDWGNQHHEFKGPNGTAVNLRAWMDFTPGLVQLYGVPLLAGRLSADHAPELAAQAVVLDRSAAAQLGFASPAAAVGQTLRTLGEYNQGRPVTVAAVVEDLKLENAREPHLANVLKPVREIRRGPISVHSRDTAATRRKLGELLREAFPEDPPQVFTVREQQARQVEDDERIGRLIAFFSGLALLMAAVGIYALAAHTLRLREREIVLRKLHGAGRVAVARLLAREFALVVGAGCALGLPVAALVAEFYLSSFVERAPMGPFASWSLLLAVAILLTVTSAAVLRHLLAAFALRPLQALQS